MVEGDSFTVIGSGAIYVFDGSTLIYSNVAEGDPDAILSMHGVTVHVLGTGDRFDLKARRPIPARS